MRALGSPFGAGFDVSRTIEQNGSVHNSRLCPPSPHGSIPWLPPARDEASCDELDFLSYNPSFEVRAAVARKDGVSDAILAALVSDPCMPVRAAIAMRTEVPFLFVLRLAADESRTVRAYALRHFCPDPLPVRWTFPDLELVAP